jgi:hypothetical protein
MTPERERTIRAMVEGAGGIFVGIQKGCDLVGGDIVMFQRVARGNTIAVYDRAIKDQHDIELAIKADVEKYAAAKAVPA